MRRSLTRRERIGKRTDIDRLFSSPLKLSCPGARLVYVENDRTFNRILIAPARGFPTAVERNRAKRRGREIFRQSKSNLRRGFDLAFILYPGAYDYGERLGQFRSLTKKAGILTDPDARLDTGI